MAKTFSHSRLWLYENCPEAYKIKYIDKKFPDLPKGIELFLGSMAHDSLEWLYNEVKAGKNVELDDLIKFYINNWMKNFSPEIRLNRGKLEDYYNKGIKFLIDYYQRFEPFSENTIETEQKILFNLDDEGEYKIVGYVDRIVKNEYGEYEVHDYKTNMWMKKQEEVDKDRQLAFYHLGINQLFGPQEKVNLLWHFLAHNRTISSRRTLAQLEELKKETLALIKKIERTTIWSACGKKFCDWCEYKKANGLQRFMNGEENDTIRRYLDN